jgi:hypothetical protein
VRVQWRRVRPAHEREDREHNERLAERLWPVSEDRPLCPPSSAVSVAKQERAVRSARALAAESQAGTRAGELLTALK